MQFFRPFVYADAAASTPLSRRARRELVRLLPLYANPGALHSSAVAAKREVEGARERIAKTLGAHPDEIIFTSGGTESNNLAITGVLRPILRERGEAAAITSAIEHPSVLEVFADLEPEGLYTIALPTDEVGMISQKMLAESVTDEVALVSIQLINSEVGTIQDVREIAKTIRRARKERSSMPLYLHVDASQAPLWTVLNVEKLGVDMLTLDGQKILGPKGVGVLYVRRGVKLEPILMGGGQEKGRRSGTENVPLIGSFAAAFEDAQKSAEANAEKISRVRDFLIAEIKRLIPNATLNGPEGEMRAPNNCNVSIPAISGELLVLGLNSQGVAASARSACSSGDEAPSHVLRALGASPELAGSAVRLTLLPSATMREAKYIARALHIVVRRQSSVLE